MKNVPLELIEARIADKAWTPGRRDIGDLFTAWRELSDDDREQMQKRMARLDAPSVCAAIQSFASLDARSRGELTRPVLKSTIHSALKINSPVTTDVVLEFTSSCLLDAEARVRKAAAQAIGNSWDDMSRELRQSITDLLLNAFGKATDQSEIKAMTEALGKSGDQRALEALQQFNQKVGVSSAKAIMTLQRDMSRGDVSGDVCQPELLGDSPLIVWFTDGVESIARMRAPFLGAEVLEPGVLKAENTRWADLSANKLWRRAGVHLGRLEDLSESSLAALLRQHSEKIVQATPLKTPGPVRIRLGRDDGRSRSYVWNFAELLSQFNCGLINDGRSAHWELIICQYYVVLVPMQFLDDRFSWRDATAEGASDPTIASALVQLAEIKPNEHVYDPFCGAGTELIIVGRSTPSARLTGTDISDRVIESAKNSASVAGVEAVFVAADALDFDAGPFDVVVTNPPFGMRTVRGGARTLLEEFLMHIQSRLSVNGRIVMLSHAPRSTRLWAEAGRMRLIRSFPVRLGHMPCELQCFGK
jgi:predicted RNA methylase